MICNTDANFSAVSAKFPCVVVVDHVQLADALDLPDVAIVEDQLLGDERVSACPVSV